MKLGFASRAVQLSSDKHNGVVVFTSPQLLPYNQSCYAFRSGTHDVPCFLCWELYCWLRLSSNYQQQKTNKPSTNTTACSPRLTHTSDSSPVEKILSEQGKKAAIATEAVYNKRCQEIVCNMTLIVIEELYLQFLSADSQMFSFCYLNPKALCERLKVTAKLKR